MPGEDIGTAAAREIKEETGIQSVFQSVLTLRHSHNIQFGRSDMYVICRMTLANQGDNISEPFIYQPLTHQHPPSHTLSHPLSYTNTPLSYTNTPLSYTNTPPLIHQHPPLIHQHTPLIHELSSSITSSHHTLDSCGSREQ